MHANFHLSPLAVCLALTIASSANAANPVLLQQSTLQNLQQQFDLVLPGLTRSSVSHKADSLQFIQEHIDKRHTSHIRMQQSYQGFMVYGGYAILHSPQNAKQMRMTQSDVSMNGTVYQGLDAELGKPDDNFVSNGSKALQAFEALYSNKTISEQQVTPMVYIDDNHKAHWAYKVSLLVVHHDAIPERPTAILAAESLKPFVQWNDIKTARTPVKGLGFGGNSKVGEFAYGKNLPLLELTRENRSSRCYMETVDVRIVDMKHEYASKNKPMQFSCKVNPKNPAHTFWTGYKGNGYDEINGAYSPANDALYAGYIIKHLYSDWYNVQVLTKKSDGSPMQLVMRVHYGDGYENAYWDSKHMTFGDGEKMMYPLVSIGIGAHEVSHGFTEQHSGLEYYGQSGGMNESFSDMAAQVAEFYSSGSNNWLIGAEIMKEDSGYDALRYMDKPSKDGGSIDSAADYHAGLDVHYSSGVYNRLFYLLSTRDGWTIRKAFDVMVKANMDYWTPYTGFTDGACGVLAAARDLNFNIDEIKESFAEVGIRTQICGKL